MPLPKAFTPPPKTTAAPDKADDDDDNDDYNLRRQAIANARSKAARKLVEGEEVVAEHDEVTVSEAFTPIVAVPEHTPFYHKILAGFEAQEGYRGSQRHDPDLTALLADDRIPYTSLVKSCNKMGLKTTENGVMLKKQILKVRIYETMRSRWERRWFKPRPIGKNWIEYWANPTRTVGWCLVGVAMFYGAYLTTEYAHDANDCRMLWRWLSYRCIIISWCRRKLEMCVNNAHLALGTLLFSKFLRSFFSNSEQAISRPY
jgi:hypothetical protein